MLVFIGLRSNHRLTLSVPPSVTAFVETWLMWPWRVKITQPLKKSSNLSLPYFTEFCQTKPVVDDIEAEVLSRFWSCRQLLQIICQNCYVNVSKLPLGFVKVVKWICQSCCMYFSPFAKHKFDRDFKACWSFYFNLKFLNEWKYSMSWVRCALGNIFII